MDDLDISVYSDETELIKVTVEDTLQFVRDTLEAKGFCHLSLTGGTVGIAIAVKLGEIFNSGEWKGLHIWFSDERFVPLDSSDRNDLEIAKILNSESGVVLHRVLGTGPIEVAADSLAKELKDIDMDLIILGMGPDGHVASLFPGKLREDESCEAFAVTDSPKPPAERVTFSLKKLNQAAEIWLVASGSAKADAITGLIEEDLSLPVSHVQLTRLMVDSLAFGV